MRFLLTVAILVGLSAAGAAQEKPRQFKTKSSANSKADSAPKSTAAIKAPGGVTTTSATSKELRNVEREHTKAVGSYAPKKARGTAAVKPTREQHNPAINFSGKSGGTGVGTRRADPSKGRLKQKGSGH